MSGAGEAVAAGAFSPAFAEGRDTLKIFFVVGFRVFLVCGCVGCFVGFCGGPSGGTGGCMENHLRLLLFPGLILKNFSGFFRGSRIFLPEAQHLVSDQNHIPVFQRGGHRKRIAVERGAVGASEIFNVPFPRRIPADFRMVARHAADQKLDVVVGLPSDSGAVRRNFLRLSCSGAVQKIKFYHLLFLLLTTNRAFRRFPAHQRISQLSLHSRIRHRRQIDDIAGGAGSPFDCSNR